MGEISRSKTPAVGQIGVIDINDSDYPPSLRHIDNPPLKLYYLGNKKLLKNRAVAVVGSRKCSEYGKQIAMRIGETIGRTRTLVVSGMAKGIDSFAHIGALKNDGNTVAVLGCGPDVCYPRENMKLYEKIKDSGLVLSEYPPGMTPKPYTFPQRNRIIAGLSEGIVVVEAGIKSGALITAEIGMNQGKEVFAVPGNITSQCSLGSNKLLVDGARPIAVIDEILIGLGIEPAAYDRHIEEMGTDEEMVYNAVKKGGEMTIDEICSVIERDGIFVSGIVSILEIKGLVAYSLGKVFATR